MPDNVSDAPSCHRCDTPPIHGWLREASPHEAKAIRDEIRRHRREEALLQDNLSDEEIDHRYGAPRVMVTGCADHDLSPAADDPGEQDPAQAGTDRRALLHAADCGGHGACACPPGA